MANRFEGKVVVVTGGSSGIGLAAAKAFLHEGARRVYVTGRNEQTLTTAVADLGPGATGIASDVAVLSDIERVVREIEGAGDLVDVVLANAGISEYSPFEATGEADFDRIFDINVKGMFFTVQKLLPVMRDGGSVVFTGSIVGNKGMADLSVYNASKAAVRSFARSWANDLKGRAIRVNTVSPGVTRTPIMENGLKFDQQAIDGFAAYLKEVSPIGRMGDPKEIAAALLFLASDEASYINGVELSVDGGFAQV
ncbi:oxidoreductase [Aureimonas sp. Leaf454]|uniref:SDR family oxidoreductase n=1 Tax=Aureimonas sp. Leaf454 TaxID=1736381 RepID=UPI0006FCADDF|nr:SDR family oxidoreductase [Aureimonas sp. Leaf454]KQT50778.1 oxidoreductase [Aureimonas sp. Leaf454]